MSIKASRILSKDKERQKEDVLSNELGFEVQMAAAQDDAIEQVIEALKAEGFGV